MINCARYKCFGKRHSGPLKLVQHRSLHSGLEAELRRRSNDRDYNACASVVHGPKRTLEACAANIGCEPMLTVQVPAPTIGQGRDFLLEHHVFDHVEYSVSNFSAAHRFYVPIFEAIGARVAFLDENVGELGVEMQGIVQFLITTGEPTQPKLHICFKALNKDAVQRAYNGAIAGGGTCNGKPGYRDHYAPGYYAAFVLDPDGHNVEILFREKLQSS